MTGEPVAGDAVPVRRERASREDIGQAILARDVSAVPPPVIRVVRDAGGRPEVALLASPAQLPVALAAADLLLTDGVAAAVLTFSLPRQPGPDERDRFRSRSGYPWPPTCPWIVVDAGSAPGHAGPVPETIRWRAHDAVIAAAGG